MSIKDDVKMIADKQNKKIAEHQKCIDNKLSVIYKEIFVLAGKGEHRLEYIFTDDEFYMVNDIVDSLKAEKFQVAVFKTKKKAMIIIFWFK